MTRSTSIAPHAAYIGSCVWSWTGHEFVNGVYHSHENEQPVLLHAPPASSKTYSTFKQIAGFQETGEWAPATYLTSRGELYTQAEQLSNLFNLTCKVIPAPKRDCPCFDPSDLRYEPFAAELYEYGVSGSTLHEVLDLPCKGRCEYIQELRTIEEEPTRFDVLIGHPLHANINAVIDERIVVFDEFPVDAFVTTFKNPGPKVNQYLKHQNKLPFDSWQDLVSNRDSSAATDLSRLHYPPVTVPGLIKLPEDMRYPCAAPYLVAAVIDGSDLGNGVEYSKPNSRTITLYEKDQDEITIFNPPTLRMTSTQKEETIEPWAILGLDGTPCRPLWDLIFAENIEERSVLSETQRRAFEKKALGLTLYRIGQGLKPYNGQYVEPAKDAKMLAEIHRWERQRPALITTKNALHQYQAEAVTELVDNVGYYGDIKSSNRFARADVGCVFGSPHPGDAVIKRWCGLLGLSTTVPGRGMNKDYGGPVQNAVYEYFVHDRVYQAVLRFVRGDSPATVYVNTETIDKWIKPDARINGNPSSTPTKDNVLRFIHGEAEVTTSDIAAEVDVGQERVRQILNELEEEGQVQKVQQGRGPLPTKWG